MGHSLALRAIGGLVTKAVTFNELYLWLFF